MKTIVALLIFSHLSHAATPIDVTFYLDDSGIEAGMMKSEWRKDLLTYSRLFSGFGIERHANPLDEQSLGGLSFRERVLRLFSPSHKHSLQYVQVLKRLREEHFGSATAPLSEELASELNRQVELRINDGHRTFESLNRSPESWSDVHADYDAYLDVWALGAVVAYEYSLIPSFETEGVARIAAHQVNNCRQVLLEDLSPNLAR